MDLFNADQYADSGGMFVGVGAGSLVCNYGCGVVKQKDKLNLLKYGRSEQNPDEYENIILKEELRW